MTSSSTRSSSFRRGKVEHAPHECKGHHWVRELLATAFDLLCLLLVKKTKFVVSIGYEWVLQRHPVRDCSHCLACTVGLFLQVRCSWAQSSSPDCCRLLTGDDGLPPRLLLLILLVWQDVACEYTLTANSVIKSTRSIQSGTTVTKKSMQTIVTNAGGVEPAESSTIAGSAKGYSTKGSCEDTGPLWQRHEFQSYFGSLVGRKKDEANVPVSTCSTPASSSSTRRPGGPGALEWIKTCMFPWQLVEFDRREEKPSFARSAPLWAWQQTKIALG